MPYIYTDRIAVSEGDAFIDFVVRLSEPSVAEVVVSYDQLAGTATSANPTPDYEFQRSTLVFAPGETSKTVSLVQIDNTTFEPTELFWLDLYNPVNASVFLRYTPVLIFDDDGATGTPAISVDNVVVDESENSARFFVSLDRPSVSTVTVDFDTADDTAFAGADYVAHSGTLSFAPGEMVKTVTVDLIDDPAQERDEYFQLTLDNASLATLADPVGVATIGRNDAPAVGSPYLFAKPLAASEGEPQLRFTVQLSAPSVNEVIVSYDQLAGTATSANPTPDYQYLLSTLVFAPGETTKTVTLQQIDNTTVEPTEGFWLDLFNEVNATVLLRYTPALIFDDDGTTGTPVISVGDVLVDESDDSARFFVSLDRPSVSTVTVDFDTADDTAFAGADYVARSGTLSFAPGEMVKTVIVDLVDDAAQERDEYFQLALDNASSATLADPAGVATIGRNDAPAVGSPYLFALPLAASEGEPQLRFTVQLSAPSVNEVKVSYDQLAGTATSANPTPDYQYLLSTLVFAPGETAKTVTLQQIDNTTVEPTEGFWLDLFNEVNATVLQRYTPALIFDDDGTTGTPVISVGDVLVDESDDSARFFVSLDRPSVSTVTVDFDTADDTAFAGADYVARSGTLSFAPGEMVKTVIVDLVDDAAQERDEYFQLALDNASSATLADPAGVATIGRNDAPAVGSPYLFALPLAASEGEPQLRFTVQLSAPSVNEVKVSFDQFAGTATSANPTPDYQYFLSTLVFAPGETAKTVTVQQIDNTVAEPTEGFWLDLFNEVNATVLTRYTPALIFDDDGTTGTPAISVDDVVVDESANSVRIVVSLDRPSISAVTVDFDTADDTAFAGEDYVARSGMLSFAPGEMVKTVTVDLIDDSTPEVDEGFLLRLANPSSATLAPDSVGTALIGANDSPPVGAPQVLARPIVASEAETHLSFTVQLSAPSVNEVTVQYREQAGTATSANPTPDYQSFGSGLLFAPGETTKTITLQQIDNTVVEPTEGFSLDLFGPVNATVPERFTAATIFDDDGAFRVLGYGIGPDTYQVDSASDAIIETDYGGTDTVETALGGYTLPENVEILRMLGSANLLGTGNELNNTFHGNSGNNTFNGGDGFDVVAFGGSVGNYAFTLGASIVAQDLLGTDGTDTLNSIEGGWFPGGIGLIEVEDVLAGRDNLSVFARSSDFQVRYTGSVAEREAWRADPGQIELAFPFDIFVPLGGVFATAATIPVYRFHDPVGDQYFWTSNAALKDDWLATRPQLWFDGEVSRGYANQDAALFGGGLGLGVNTLEQPGAAGDVGHFALTTTDGVAALVGQGYVDYGTAFWV